MLLPAVIALTAALFGFRTPRWLLLACLSCAIPVAEFVQLALERREDDRLRRAMQPYCFKCGYDLTGNPSGVCPECGHHFLEA